MGDFELERNPLFLLLPGETKGAQGLIKNMASYSPGIDVLKLDGSEVTVLWINVCKGKDVWTWPGKSCLHHPCK